MEFDFPNKVIEEGEDLRDFAVERLGESTNEVHIEILRDRGDGRCELEREIIYDVFDRFTTLAFTITLRGRRVGFGIGFGGRGNGRGRDRGGEVGVVANNQNILGRSIDDVLINIVEIVLGT